MSVATDPRDEQSTVLMAFAAVVLVVAAAGVGFTLVVFFDTPWTIVVSAMAGLVLGIWITFIWIQRFDHSGYA